MGLYILAINLVNRERGAVSSPLDFDVPLSLTAGHSRLQPTTPIVVSEVGGLYQTIWDTMERHFGLEIRKPMLILAANVSKSRIVKEVGDDFGVLAGWIVIASIITVRFFRWE